MGASTECAPNSIRAKQNKSAILEDLQENMILSRTQFKTQREKKFCGVVSCKKASIKQKKNFSDFSDRLLFLSSSVTSGNHSRCSCHDRLSCVTKETRNFTHS
jgi:hypothetical protein